MKKLIHSIIVLLLSTTVFAQAPQSFKYQAVARDASSEVIADQQVNFQISILQSSESGIAVYTETHVDSTNQFGLVTLEIGTGTTSDDFTTIDWGSDTYFIQVEMDASGGTSYTLMGTSQLLSVPYALHARTAANIFSGNYSDLTNKPEIPDTLSDLVLDAGNNNITNLADPINDQNAATKAYVDELIDQILELQAEVGVTDIDGNHYKAVRIGNQVWLAENLKTTKYNDGNAIPLVEAGVSWINLTSPGYCWYDNDSTTYASLYGALYNWYTVNTGKLCPSGWHVPSDAGWTTLVNYLIANGYNFDGTTNGNKIAKALASTTGWSYNTYLGAPGNTDFPAFRNKTGFTAFPGGSRELSASFAQKGFRGHWWSLDGSWRIQHWLTDFSSYDNDNNYGFSVRCLKDE